MRALITSVFILCSGFLVLGWSSHAKAQDSQGQAECSAGLCGTPDQSGGGCGCGCGCSILVAMTDRGDTYQFADDFDGDGLEDEYDNCAFAANYDQGDSDRDGVGDACDRCVNMADPEQLDTNGNGLGDACDDDIDGDSFLNSDDDCPGIPNRSQTNTDGDLLGDACDDDDDNDGFLDIDDGCRLLPGTAAGANCDDDEDGDGIFTADDNCPSIENPVEASTGFQADVDGDHLGDACDSDADDDGVENLFDNCPLLANPGQVDLDGDGAGDGGVWGSGPESCDQRECYMVPGKADCLDPHAAFRIDMTAVDRMGQFMVDDTIILVMLTNRLQAMHSWTARIEEAPNGSEVQLINAKGAASTLGRSPQVTNCLRQGEDGSCQEMNSIRFKPDMPGKYVIKVTAELPRGDDLGPSTATATITTEIAGAAAGGCNTSGSAGAIGAAFLGVMALIRRRRR